MLLRRHAEAAKSRKPTGNSAKSGSRRMRASQNGTPERITWPAQMAGIERKLRRDADACANRLDRLARRGPEVPARAEQVVLHPLAARPGVPELLRIERTLGSAGDLVERDAEMPAEQHRQHVAGHRLVAV